MVAGVRSCRTGCCADRGDHPDGGPGPVLAGISWTTPGLPDITDGGACAWAQRLGHGDAGVDGPVVDVGRGPLRGGVGDLDEGGGGDVSAMPAAGVSGRGLMAPAD